MIILLTLTCMLILLYILFVLMLIILLVYYLDHIWACYPFCYSFWLSYSHLACVWTWMIYKRFVWLPVAWMLFSCVFAWLFVYVGCISIPLPPILWFRPFPSFQFLHLQVWGLMCACFSDRANWLGVGSSDRLYQCLGAFWRRWTH